MTNLLRLIFKAQNLEIYLITFQAFHDGSCTHLYTSIPTDIVVRQVVLSS
jgi:hypothetical protein